MTGFKKFLWQPNWTGLSNWAILIVLIIFFIHFFFPNWTGSPAETQSYVVVQVKHKMANDMLQQNFRGWTLNPNRNLDANKNKGRLYLKHSFLQNTALKSRNPLKRRYNPSAVTHSTNHQQKT